MRAATVILVLALAFAAAGCGGGSSEEGAASVAEGPASVATDNGSIVGEWQRETTCAELVRVLKTAGMGSRIPEFVAGNGFIPGVRTPDELKDPSRPCDGAVPRTHSHFFTRDGAFGSRDWNGENVDDGTYRADGETVTISKEFPDVTFRYRIEGDTITFDPLVPDGCTTFRCAWSVSVAYPGYRWTRAD